MKALLLEQDFTGCEKGHRGKGLFRESFSKPYPFYPRLAWLCPDKINSICTPHDLPRLFFFCFAFRFTLNERLKICAGIKN